MKARLVLDTNVWVAALRSSRGASRAVIDRVLEGRATLHVTVPLIMEYEAVLQRHGLTFSKQEIEALLDLICAIAEPHECTTCGDGRSQIPRMPTCWKPR